MKRAVGALKRTGGFTIPGAVPQADIKRAFGPKLTASHTISLSPTFNHTQGRAKRFLELIVCLWKSMNSSAEDNKCCWWFNSIIT